MFESLRSYGRHIPADLTEHVLKSGCFSFAIGTLMTQNIQAGVAIGGISALASLIHGLTAPIFRELFSDSRIKWYQTAVQMTVNIILTQVIVNAVTPLRVNLLATALVPIGIGLLLENFQDRSLSRSMTYIVF